MCLIYRWDKTNGLSTRAVEISTISGAENAPTVAKQIMVDENPSHMDEMIKITGEKTVPQIFIGDHYIGGNDKLQEANRTGELDNLLKS